MKITSFSQLYKMSRYSAAVLSLFTLAAVKSQADTVTLPGGQCGNGGIPALLSTGSSASASTTCTITTSGGDTFSIQVNDFAANALKNTGITFGLGTNATATYQGNSPSQADTFSLQIVQEYSAPYAFPVTTQYSTETLRGSCPGNGSSVQASFTAAGTNGMPTNLPGLSACPVYGWALINNLTIYGDNKAPVTITETLTFNFAANSAPGASLQNDANLTIGAEPSSVPLMGIGFLAMFATRKR